MRIFKQCLATFLALLMAMPAHAVVDLATTPIGSRTQATPNMIFGLDDSGSTEDEVLLNTSDGALWYENATSTFWNSAGVMNPNSAYSFSTHKEFDYLFPNGSSSSSTSDKRRYGDSSSSYAIPPIPTYAFLRSSNYNPLYYDRTVRYTPWPAAYIGGTTVTFSNAVASAARSHPYYPSSGATTFNLVATQSSTASDWTFRFLPGMVIPGATISGIQGRIDGASSYSNITTNVTVASGRYYDVNVPYYPATYWFLDSTCTAAAADCTTAPDHTTPSPKRLRRIEVRSTTPTYSKAATRTDCAAATCSYAEEIQNFANWFQFYRKRRLALAAGVGGALANIRGIRGGLTRYNNPSVRPDVTMYDFSATAAASNVQAFLGQVYTADAAGGTPTRAVLKFIGDQYARTDSSAPIQFGCQRNSAFILTDGYNTDVSSSAPAYSRSTYITGAPFTTTPTNSIADIAGALFTNNPRSDLPAGLLSLDPTYTGSNPDRNINLHVNTHALTLGAKGTIYGSGTPSDNNPFLNPPTWPAVTTGSTPAQVDDLWHATINGRGSMYRATNAGAITSSLNTLIRGLLVSAGSDAGIAVSSFNIRSGNNTAYVSSYNAQDWTGQLCAYSIDITTGVVNTSTGAETWCARDSLNAQTSASRKIASFDGASGAKFQSSGAGALGSTTVNYLNLLTSSDGPSVLQYIRGDRSLEGTSYRTRTHLLGDIVSAEPLLDNGVIYQPSNDGMLHAFDAANGAELWAYVPWNAMRNGTVKERARDPYTHSFTVDGTPTIQDITSRKILVGHLRGGGPGYYAVDITDPRPNSENTLRGNVMWEFPNASQWGTLAGQVGSSYGKPVIAKHSSGTWLVLVTSGYNNTSGQSHLHVLNATTGAVLQTITTPSGSGLAQLSAWVVNPASDLTVDYVYGGDLSGNLWRFNLTPAIGSFTVEKLATFANAAGAAQPIMSAPELTTVGSRRLIVVGTGQLLGDSDLSTTGTHSVYAVVDDRTATPTLATPRTQLFGKTVTTATGGIRNISSAAVDYALYRGWYFDLPAGERVTTDPSIAFGVVTFTTNYPTGTACSSQSFIYAVDAQHGGQMPAANFGTATPWSGRQIGYTYASRPVVITLPSGKVVAVTHKSDAAVASSDIPVVQSNALRKIGWREVQR